MALRQKSKTLLPPAASDCASGIRLEKSEENSTINRCGRSTHPKEKSVRRRGAAPRYGPLYRHFAGPQNADIEAAEEVWKFFHAVALRN
jgi:hypothetical protein